MKLLGNTRKLDIITENCFDNEKDYEHSGIKYHLYELDYISGVRMIFQQAIEKEEWLRENADRFIVDEKRNILSFIGTRGSGKTTAMDEFCQILRAMQNVNTREWWIAHTLNSYEKEKLGRDTFNFHVLNPIDASLLEKTEDLFELILANMYKQFENKMKNNIRSGFSEDPQVRKIINSFSEISKLYRNVVRREKDEYGTALFSKLQLKAGSQEIQAKVANLVEDLFILEGTKVKHEYIVIAIDDLDLNLEFGYEMLEQIQKYFSYHKILILMAIDYDQMQLVCEEHFWRGMPNTTKAYSEKYSEKNRKLANDYMIKLFHFSQRMYMPEMHRIAKKAEIKLPKIDNKEIETVQVKRFVMSKIAESMLIYYDACGMKNHFSEPETVRNLVSYNEFLESLDVIEFKKLVCYEKINGDKAIEKTNLEILRKYSNNHERFNQDINVRLVQNILTYNQYKAFEKLNGMDLERRAKYFVLAHRVDKEIKFCTVMDSEYTYGDLLQKIFEWGRVEGSDYFEDKPFIRCILASFTSEMVCEYLKYRYNPLLDMRIKYKKRLLGFLGESFGNDWVGKMFPDVNAKILNDKYATRKRITNYGYNAVIEPQNLSIKISLAKLKKIKALPIKELDKRELIKGIGEWLEDEKIIETLECIDMFLIRREKDAFRRIEFVFKYEIKEKKSFEDVNIEKELANSTADEKKATETDLSLAITGAGEVLKLDLMAFVAKSMDYKQEKNELQTNIIEGLTGFLGRYLQMGNNTKKMSTIKDIISEEVNKRSLFRFIDKSFEYEVAFPFYDLDLSYNIFKRVREHYKNKVVLEEKLINEIVEFYKYIQVLLNNQKVEYMKLGEFKYSEIFENCPYIKAIKEWKEMGENSKIAIRLSEVLNSMTVGVDTKIED